MVTLTITQLKMGIYFYIYMEEKCIYIYKYIYKSTDLWNSLPQYFQILSLFKERMDIYGKTLVIPARDLSTLQGARQAPSIQRQEEILFVNHHHGDYFHLLLEATS